VRRLVALALLVGVTACGGSRAPAWLRRAGHEGLRFYVHGAKPESETYVVEKDRAFAVYDLHTSVVCGGCSAPPGAVLPHGDALSLAFDARTHRLTDMALCDVRTECPTTPGFEALRR
jgi:hypothetical protein